MRSSASPRPSPSRTGASSPSATTTTVLKLKGPKTRLIDAGGRTVLPGLYDSHVHPSMPPPASWTSRCRTCKSLKDVFAYIRKQAAKHAGRANGSSCASPSRRGSTRPASRRKAELDEAAPKHPVLYNAGPAGMVNSMALKVSGVTKDTPNPTGGVIVKDPTTGEPTGMLRNA